MSRFFQFFFEINTKKVSLYRKMCSQICECQIIFLSLSPKSERSMIVTFEEDYLRELYEDGQASDKKHRFQPQIIKKYTRVVDLMMVSLTELSNHYKNT
jgi:hypothetical protein